MIGLEERTVLAQDIASAQRAGARLEHACAEAGICVRTLQRWKANGALLDNTGQTTVHDHDN
jgi:putative transposase